MPRASRPVPRRRCLLRLAALAAMCALAGTTGAWAPPANAVPVRIPAEPDDPVPNDPGTIVGVRSVREAREVAQPLRAAGLKVHVIPRIGALFVRRAGEAAVRRVLRSDERVRWIEPTRERTLLAEPSARVDPSTGRAFDWAYDAVSAGPAISAAGGGSAAAVAVVDSGVDATHPDLAGRLAEARDIAFGQEDAKDEVGHGTFVAGLITAVDGNGIGTRGVAGKTTVIPVRVTATGSITSANAAAGIVAAVDAGASVVNLSFGGPTISAAERAALDYAAEHDVLVVAASGNTGATGNVKVYPAAAIGGNRGGWSAGISVAAVDPAGAPAPFSTWNDNVTLSAPGAGRADDCGDGVYSTIPQQATMWSSNTCLRSDGASGNGAGTGRYAYAEGTSFAAPIVAGGAALVRGVNPRLTAAQAVDVLRSTTHQTVGNGWNARTGAGVVNLAAAVAEGRRYDVTPPVPAVTASPTAGGVAVSVVVSDAALVGVERAPVTSVKLEGSSDGVNYTAIAPDAGGTIRLTDPAAPGARRWYRATACDANRNCGSTTAGPVAAGGGRGTSALLAGARPALASVSADRPRACATCLRIAFTAKGRGPLAWVADVSGAGIKLRRDGRLSTARRHTVQVRLPRLPTCGGRVTVTLRLTSSHGQARSRGALRVTGRCRSTR